MSLQLFLKNLRQPGLLYFLELLHLWWYMCPFVILQITHFQQINRWVNLNHLRNTHTIVQLGGLEGSALMYKPQHVSASAKASAPHFAAQGPTNSGLINALI